MTHATSSAPDLRIDTARGRWVIAVTVLGSGIAFLDGTVVNAALPAISADLGSNLADLQWVLTGYLLTLGSLLVVGGSIGDLFGRRRAFVAGLLGFGVASMLCAIAPSNATLIGARCIQGIAAALLVPGSLAIISASFCAEDRGRAIGAWSGLAGVALGLAGLFAILAFLTVERVSTHPMVPLAIFRSRQFSGANLVTLVVYAAFGASTFLLVVHLQTDLGYSALEAGASLLPVTILMLLFSARAGEVAQRVGPRIPMTIGPAVVGAGMALLALAEPGTSYWRGVLPGTFVLALGLTITVAPLTATVLASIDDHHAGVGSAINNAVARVGGLLAIAVLPAVAGLAGADGGLDLDAGFGRAMVSSGVLAALGSVVAWGTISRCVPVREIVIGTPAIGCGPAALAETDESA
ncbi:MAG TPA: MFS transporter [Acidimicrobiia bacterium]|nr:MFS transporter [Acidimicrobiia bacterium]